MKLFIISFFLVFKPVPEADHVRVEEHEALDPQREEVELRPPHVLGAGLCVAAAGRQRNSAAAHQRDSAAALGSAAAAPQGGAAALASAIYLEVLLRAGFVASMPGTPEFCPRKDTSQVVHCDDGRISTRGKSLPIFSH